MDLHPLEMAVTGCDIDPITVAKMKDGCCGYDGVGLFLFALKRGRYKHPNLEEARVRKLDTHLGGTYGWIEDRLNIRDSSRKLSTWIRIRIDGRGLAQRDLRQIIFINVAENPNE